MSAQILPSTTAGIDPEQFSDDLFFARNRKFAAIILAVFLLMGFALRVGGLGTESLGEDELNKLQTVEDYRANGLSGRNGEHPFLMKGLQLVSIVTAEKINNSVSSPQLRISDEAALRFPLALFGTFTVLLIYLLVSQLFGRSIGLISAALWAVEPFAIGFDRIAKEDSLVLFFFLLTCVFWIRSQTGAERSEDNWIKYVWAMGISFGALMASKYYLFLLAITQSYYNIFQSMPATKWRLGKARFIKLFIIMIVTFLILNPTILLPGTWKEILTFSSENRIAHDSYEFMGGLYTNQMSLWLAGVPWTFYFVFVAVKTSIATLTLFLIGLPMMFKRRLGDGRFLIFFWAFIWLLSFTFLGGKFTRYFAIAAPLILITAAVGFYYAVRWLSTKLFAASATAAVFQIILFVTFVAFPLLSSVLVAPHFRLFTNAIGGGMSAAGYYFPHDEFYDLATREIVTGIAERASPGATVACETPTLFEYYGRQIGRADLNFVSLSDKTKVAALRTGDLVVLAKGRRYFSNAAYQDYLDGSATPSFETKTSGVTSARIYQLDAETLAGIQVLAK